MLKIAINALAKELLTSKVTNTTASTIIACVERGWFSLSSLVERCRLVSITYVELRTSLSGNPQSSYPFGVVNWFPIGTYIRMLPTIAVFLNNNPSYINSFQWVILHVLMNTSVSL